MSTYNILILGASCGSLLALKILLGAHSVKWPSNKSRDLRQHPGVAELSEHAVRDALRSPG